MKQTKSLSKRFASYRQFIDRLPVGMAVLHVPDLDNTKTWAIVAANWLAVHLVGSSADAFLNGSIAANLPPSKPMTALVRNTISFGKPKTLGHLADRDSLRCLSAYWARLFPIDDCCVGFSIEDHSLLRQARGARMQAERQCRLISELARAILWRADPETLQVNYVSPEGQQILGFWPERWRSESNFWQMHVHPEDLARVISYCRSAQDGVYEDCEFRMISSSERVIWFRLLVRHVVGTNGARELLGVMTEINKLKEAEQHTQELSRRLIHLQDREHRRISRELHDSVGQNLASLRMSLHALEQKSALLDDQARTALRDAASLADSAIQETRTVSYLLHPPVLDELGLVKALDWFVDGFAKRSGISVRLQAPPRPFRLPAEMELALFRVVQECLTNVHRHSHSTSAEVRIQAHSTAILLEVSDSGRGIPPKVQTELLQGSGKTGLGICGIRERITEMNGSLDIDSNRDGTTVRVLVPAPPQPAAQDESTEHPDVIPFVRTAARGKT
jgi:two-component system, NarL family, sensor kinase